MAKLITPSFFTWKEMKAKGDLQRLMLVLTHLSEEELIQQLKKQRTGGRIVRLEER